MRIDSVRLIQDSNGIYNKFRQGEYIKKNKWDHCDSLKRKGAWTGNSYDRAGRVVEYGFESGVCQGLIGAYLISGQSWCQFSSYISSERGKTLVRGIMNFQEHLSASGNMKEMKNVFHGILKPHSVYFIREEIRLTENTPIKMSQAILNNVRQGNGYHISIKKSSGGHSLGIRAEANQIKFFDPNYGETVFPCNKGVNDEMERFLTHVFSQYYSQYFMLTVEHYAVP